MTQRFLAVAPGGGTTEVVPATTSAGSSSAGQIPALNSNGAVDTTMIPAPTGSTLGGVQSFTTTTSRWVSSLSTSGVFTTTQPAVTDITGLPTMSATGGLLYDSGTNTVGNGLITYASFGAGSAAGWLNFPTAGPSGLGTGGAGSNAWIGYCAGAGNWFTNSAAGDLAYRNGSGRILMGTNATNPSVVIGNAVMGVGSSTAATPTHVLEVGTTGQLTVDGSGNLATTGTVSAGTSSAFATNTTGIVTTYGGYATAGNGLAQVTAASSQGSQSANVTTAQTLQAISTGPSSGSYRINYYMEVVTAATTSSTLPLIVLSWKSRDASTAVTQSVGTAATNNIVGSTFSNGSVVISAKNTSAISWTTTGYASSGTTAMKYTVRVSMEYLG